MICFDIEMLLILGLKSQCIAKQYENCYSTGCDDFPFNIWFVNYNIQYVNFKWKEREGNIGLFSPSASKESNKGYFPKNNKCNKQILHALDYLQTICCTYSIAEASDNFSDSCK